jgi:uncharacterized protein (DUF2252 family)
MSSRSKPAPGARASARPLPDPEYLPRRTLEDRVAQGRALREETPPARLAEWSEAGRQIDPVEVLRVQSARRTADLVPIRHARMMVSPFAFYRGAAAVMAGDLAGSPTCGLRAQLCGDAHVSNFGIFDTPQRSLLFGINDFDETLPGPVEWDVKRLAASVDVAARDLGFGAVERESAVLATARGYRKGMRGFARMRNLEVWYARLERAELRQRLAEAGGRRTGKQVAKQLRKATGRDHLHAFDRLLHVVDGRLEFRSDPPLMVPVAELLAGVERDRYVKTVRSFLRQYRASLPPERATLLRSYRYVGMARKVVGVGSVGTRCWVVLMMGRDSADPLLLQLKEAQESVLAPYAGATEYESEGRRVVEGQRLIQAASDALLGWYGLVGFDGLSHDFYVRQLWDGKASVDIASLTSRGLAAYGRYCGWTLARAHARSGDRVALAAYLGKDSAFEEAIAAFAAAYADTNERDLARLRTAVERGQLPAAAAPDRSSPARAAVPY